MPLRRAVAAGLAVVLAAVVAAAPRSQDTGEMHRECYQGSVPDRIHRQLLSHHSRPARRQAGHLAAFKARGDTYDNEGEYELAVRDYTESLALEPQDAEVFNARGTTRTAMGQYELAIQDFDRAIELEPEKGMAFSNRCFAAAVLGRLDAALADCNEAIRLHRTRYATFASRGFVYLKLGRADEAIADYNKVLAKRPDDPYALFGRAAAELAKGDLKAAMMMSCAPRRSRRTLPTTWTGSACD